METEGICTSDIEGIDADTLIPVIFHPFTFAILYDNVHVTNSQCYNQVAGGNIVLRCDPPYEDARCNIDSGIGKAIVVEREKRRH